MPILAAAAAFAVVAVVILLARSHQGQPGPVTVAPLPPASPGAVSSDYVGSRWRLTAVTDRRGTTEIPASTDAWLELAADGELIASDDVNTISGHFTITSAGFDVSDTATTLVGFADNDPARVAAVIGIDAVTINSQAARSAASSAPEAQPVHVTCPVGRPRTAERPGQRGEAHVRPQRTGPQTGHSAIYQLCSRPLIRAPTIGRTRPDRTGVLRAGGASALSMA